MTKISDLINKLGKIYTESYITIEARFHKSPYSEFIDPFNNLSDTEKTWYLNISDVADGKNFKTFDDLCKYVTEINIQHITENQLLKEMDEK